MTGNDNIASIVVTVSEFDLEERAFRRVQHDLDRAVTPDESRDVSVVDVWQFALEDPKGMGSTWTEISRMAAGKTEYTGAFFAHEYYCWSIIALTRTALDAISFLSRLSERLARRYPDTPNRMRHQILGLWQLLPDVADLGEQFVQFEAIEQPS